MANDVDIYNGISKALNECVVKVQASEDSESQSFEYMRRKLWCDVIAKLIGTTNMPVEQMADAAVEGYDKRFGNGEGE